MPVVLLDTFEDIGDRTRRDLERLIQRMVWLMPNAFWVITGRSRLQWAHPALQGQLDYTGPTAWPARNYRFPANGQVIVDADTRLVIAAARPVPSATADAHAWRASGLAVCGWDAVTEGRGRSAGVGGGCLSVASAGRQHVC